VSQSGAVADVSENGGSSPFSTERIAACLTVIRENHAPKLAAIGDRSVIEGLPLDLRLSASDPEDIPPDRLTFSATGLPLGATFDSTTGTFHWTPAEADGSGSYPITFTVTDDGQPSLSASETVTLTVLPALDLKLSSSSGKQFLIHRFAHQEALRNWQRSDALASLLIQA
jgi:hypothetical protein